MAGSLMVITGLCEVAPGLGQRTFQIVTADDLQLALISLDQRCSTDRAFALLDELARECLARVPCTPIAPPPPPLRVLDGAACGPTPNTSRRKRPGRFDGSVLARIGSDTVTESPGNKRS